MTYCTINYHVNVWERGIILKVGLVEISEINTNPHFAVFFGNMDDIGQPLGVPDH